MSNFIKLELVTQVTDIEDLKRFYANIINIGAMIMTNFATPDIKVKAQKTIEEVNAKLTEVNSTAIIKYHNHMEEDTLLKLQLHAIHKLSTNDLDYTVEIEEKFLTEEERKLLNQWDEDMHTIMLASRIIDK